MPSISCESGTVDNPLLTLAVDYVNRAYVNRTARASEDISSADISDLTFDFVGIMPSIGDRLYSLRYEAEGYGFWSVLVTVYTIHPGRFDNVTTYRYESYRYPDVGVYSDVADPIAER